MKKGKPEHKPDMRAWHGKADPVRIQISVKVRAPIVGGRRIEPSRKLVQTAIARWIATGKQTPMRGIRISAVEWENYGRGRPAKRNVSRGGIEHARTSLRLPAMLTARGISFFRVSRPRSD